MPQRVAHKLMEQSEAMLIDALTQQLSGDRP
jgi:hypothetical protein